MMNDEQDDVVELPGDDEPVRLRPRPGWVIRDYMELMRLPNVFTAMADVAMGFLFVQPIVAQSDSWALGLLIAASSMLYIAGVVLNDVFDLETDRTERPERPLPSGRISLRAARWVGWKFLLLGVLLGTGASFFVGQMRPGVVVALLATCILLYNAWLKRTPLGPLAMGACRMLNVMLGMSVLDAPLQAEHWLVAGAIGVYVAGVTWFARTEAQRSSRLHLSLATSVMMLGVAMLGWFPSWSPEIVIPLLQQQPQRWQLLMVLLGLLIGYRCLWAVLDPISARVRLAVAHSILSLVILDAAACYAIRDVFPAALILLLLLPAMFLGRWIEST